MMLAARLVFAACVPIGADFFQKREKLLGLLGGKSTEKLCKACFALGVIFLYLSLARVGKADICRAAVSLVGSADNISGVFQLLDYLTGRAGLNIQLLGQLALGDAAFLAENVQNALLSTSAAENHMALVGQLAHLGKNLVTHAHFVVVGETVILVFAFMVLAFVLAVLVVVFTLAVVILALAAAVLVTVPALLIVAVFVIMLLTPAFAAGRDDTGTEIFFTATTGGIAQIAALAAAGADVFVFAHIKKSFQNNN